MTTRNWAEVSAKSSMCRKLSQTLRAPGRGGEARAGTVSRRWRGAVILLCVLCAPGSTLPHRRGAELSELGFWTNAAV